jgi:hypothetical protein
MHSGLREQDHIASFRFWLEHMFLPKLSMSKPFWKGKFHFVGASNYTEPTISSIVVRELHRHAQQGIEKYSIFAPILQDSAQLPFRIEWPSM